jgi:hypothetical protein
MASNIVDRLNKVLDTLNNQNIAQVAYKKFVDVTPIAKKNGGNAKRSTKLNGNNINANYAYANVLDKGRHMTNRGMRGSEQAPIGMTEPTIEHVRDYVKQKLGITIK